MIVARFVSLFLMAATAMASSQLETELKAGSTEVDLGLSKIPDEIWDEIEGGRHLADECEVDLDAMDWDTNKPDVDVGMGCGLPPGAVMVTADDNGDPKVSVSEEKMEPVRRKMMETEIERKLAGKFTDKLILVIHFRGVYIVAQIAYNFVIELCDIDIWFFFLWPLKTTSIHYRFWVSPKQPLHFRGRKCRTKYFGDGTVGSVCVDGAVAFYLDLGVFDFCGFILGPIFTQPFIEGEPHFAQWRGNKFDYQGECDMVFTHAPSFGNGIGMDIHARTKIRYDYSYIESAAVKIGDDVLEVSSFGDYFFNGVLRHDMTDATLAGYPVTFSQPMDKKTTFDIELGGGNVLSISSMKDIVSIRFDVAKDVEGQSVLYEWFGDSSGMIGSMVNPALVGRDGAAIADPNSFGQEWQVQGDDPKLFVDAERAPQYPAKCNLPSADAYKTNRRLGATISEEDAAEACKNWPQDQMKDCISDVIAMHDLEFAQAGSY